MKEKLHPEYHEVTVHCACGATWTTHSTKKELRLEICSKCHPFFTGKQKLIDSAGRVERFQKRYTQAAPATGEAAKAAESAGRAARRIGGTGAKPGKKSGKGAPAGA